MELDLADVQRVGKKQQYQNVGGSRRAFTVTNKRNLEDIAKEKLRIARLASTAEEDEDTTN